MKRLLTGLAGGLGLAALLRLLGWRGPGSASGPDPAAELRRKLEEARGAPDDRAEFDAAEGAPVDEAEPAPAPAPRSIEERRRAIHEKAQEALGEMQRPSQDDPSE